MTAQMPVMCRYGRACTRKGCRFLMAHQLSMKMNILQKSTIKLDEKGEVQFLYEGRTTIPEKSPNLYYAPRYILSNLKLIGKLKQKLLHGNHCSKDQQ
jgi:hypothetical protein